MRLEVRQHDQLQQWCSPLTWLLTRLAPNSYVPMGILMTWALFVGTSTLPANRLWQIAKFWFSGLVKSKRRPSNVSGFRITALARQPLSTLLTGLQHAAHDAQRQ